MKTWIAIANVLWLLSFTACGSEDPATQKSGEAAVPQAEKNRLEFGESAEFESIYSLNDGPELETSLDVTPLSIESESEPYAWATESADAAQGKVRNPVWLKLKVELRSMGRDQAKQSDLYYTLVDDQGERFIALDTVNAFQPVISCCGSGYDGNEMPPGDKATGFVAFRLPKNAVPTKLRVGESGDGDYQDWELPEVS